MDCFQKDLILNGVIGKGYISNANMWLVSIVLCYVGFSEYCPQAVWTGMT